MPSREVQVAENESRFRAVNERLLAADAGHANTHDRIAFLCECGDESCTMRIELTPLEYRQARADGATFALLPGHELPAYEEVIERDERFLLVRKLGLAGEIAEEHDPRS